MTDEDLGLFIAESEVGKGAQLDADGCRQAEKERRLALRSEAQAEIELSEDSTEEPRVALHDAAELADQLAVARG